MVEFALVGPLFFVLLFGAVNCGLVLFSINAADQAANIGVQQLAALGDYDGAPPAGSNLPNPSNADDIALYEMQQVGLANTGNASVVSVRITQLSSPSLTDACATADCFHLYTVATKSWSGNWYPGGTDSLGNPVNRNTTSTDADYIRLDVTYSYQWLFGAGPALQLTASRVIRLEPQS
jgi:TadE-like protein